MKIKTIAPSLAFILLIALSGCGGNADFTDTSNVSYAEETVANYTDESNDDALKDESATKIDRKLIKTGFVEFEVTSSKEERLIIANLVEKHGAYVSSEYEYESVGRKYSELSLRVPSINFDQLVIDLGTGVDEFDRKEITVQDVTEEFIDLKIRIETKKELEKRYREILEKANSVAEILEIEGEINLIRTEIESFEGRLKYLTNSVDYSTITISYYEKVDVDNEFTESMGDGFTNGWENLVWFFIFLINIWPFILIATIVTVLIIRKRNSKK